MQKITVKDIAERIRRPREQLQTAIDRVRNWTKEGFLSVVGDKNPGVGRARNYSKDALLEAALLNIVSDAGMTAAGAAPNMRLLMAIVEKYWKGTDPFQSGPPIHKAPRRAAKRVSLNRPLLVISKKVGSGDVGITDFKLSELQTFMLSGATAGATLHTIVDLEALFDGLLNPLEKD